ncbi:MAG: PAS domain S-box protein [Verrucomicrobiales bacterium]|nr:PAS domain S-box protein [Verrucomicrobiales bacterium]
MNKRLQILHLEDEPDFAELVCTLLDQDNLEADVKRVSDRLAFMQALDGGSFDLIISDYHLPSFTGLEALGIAKKKCPRTPFILVSGTIGEQAAIESLKAGATDYVLKQHPDRLPSAVRRAVQEAGERAKLHGAETELIRREKYFRALTENALDVLSILNREGVFTYKSPSVKKVLGYEPQELVGTNIFTHIHPEDLSRAQEAFQTGLAEPGRAVTLQFRYAHKDGSWRYLEAIGQNRLDDPDVNGIVVNSRDVSDRWQAEEDLRDSEKQYRLLFHGNPNPMWVFDLESLKFLEVNEAAIRQYGYSREEFLGMTITDLRAPEKNDQHKKDVVEATERGVIWRHRRKDGGFLDAEVVWSPMAFRNRFAALTMATDVTERRRAEHRNTIFSKLSQRLSSATTVAETAMIICEAADGLFKWSDFALDLYFAETDEVFSLLNITTVGGRRVEIPPSFQPKTANALIRRVVNRGAELLSSDDSKDHSAATMLAPILKGTNVIGVLLIQNSTPGAFTVRDLEMLQTLASQSGGALERVRAEDQLRQTQERFHDLFDNSPDAIFVEKPDGTVLDVNLAACVLHGMTREQMIGKNSLEDLLPPASREAARRDFQKLTEGKLTWTEGESLTADGRVIPVEVRASRIEYDDQPALLLHVRDITQRRSAETALQSSEMLFRSVWENSVDGMRLTDENGVIIAVNDAFCKLFGMEASLMEGQPFTVVYAELENRPEMISSHRDQFLTRTTDQKSERQYVLHNGQTVTMEITHSFVEVHGRTLLMLSLFRDVTLQRRLEEQLRQSQKMEAIGQLAGGIAHDFNNILTVIHGHASLLEMSDLNKNGARSAQQILQAAERAAALTRQLLAFSRRQLIQPKRLDMNLTVGNMTEMLGRLLGEDVELQLNYSPSPATVEADSGMMEQVLLNLAVNARDAMPRGGHLAIRIAVVDIDQAHVQRHPEARTGRFVCVSKSDTGCGIPPENIPRIFEPFFTTKEIGKGTGLGLATVYGIVKQHQGWIEVESTLGKGTTFRVYLPFLGSTPVDAEKPTTQITIRGGSETILLVEDEPPVRELVASVLQKYGYKILQAGSGHEAVGVWHKHKDKINLLLTDLVMPGNMNGHELAEKLQAGQPALKVIFTSGYSADIVGKNFKLDASLNFLQKPYHPNTLAQTVRRCLDGKGN